MYISDLKEEDSVLWHHMYRSSIVGAGCSRTMDSMCFCVCFQWLTSTLSIAKLPASPLHTVKCKWGILVGDDHMIVVSHVILETNIYEILTDRANFDFKQISQSRPTMKI